MASLSLVFDILARDRGASRTFNDVGDSADRAGKAGERAGNLIKGGALAIGAGLAAAGVASLSFVKDAAESAKIARLTEAVLKSTGGAANVTAEQVDNLATAISNKTAVDDEAIVSGANLLLTFTKVRNEVGEGNDVFDQATQAAVDMSVALGTDVTAASLQLGKALNDPIKGVTALSKAGVSFTQQQKDQIKAMVEAGDTLGAQKIILGEMAVQFGGAAEAAADPMARLTVISGNLAEKVGGVLLPHVEDFATFLGDTAAPRLAEFIEEFERGEGPVARVADAIGAVRAAGKFLTDSWNTELSPAAQNVARWFRADVQPVLDRGAAFLKQTFTPAWRELVAVYNENVKPSVDEVRAAFNENRPAIESVMRAVGLLVGGWLAMELKIRGTILPVLIDLAGKGFSVAADAAGWLLDRVSDLTDAVSTASGWFQTSMRMIEGFTDKLDSYKLPGWLKTLADTVSGISGSMGSAAGKVASFFGAGDGPGRYGVSGGNTLARVQSLLPAGTRVTSTYRTPAHNAAVGGVPGSFHTDRANPAVDIGGPTAALDVLHAKLSAMGGWRELLWRTAGHWDHVHVAHDGGTVSANWPTMPGWGANERPVRAEVGEVIVPKGGAQPVKTYNTTINNIGGRLTGADLRVAQREAEIMAGDW